MPVFNPARILLPGEEHDIAKWAVVACDQFTSEPDYWRQADAFVNGAPSTLRIILPEAYLESPDLQERTRAIHQKMRAYEKEVLTRAVDGFVYLERTLQSGRVRQGLVGCVDLEEYSYEPGAACRVRPSEHTVVERIPPRLAVRRGASLESPHILMLIDDENRSVIEPLAAAKAGLAPLYDAELMLGGGRVRGWAVTGEEEKARIAEAIETLADPAAFAVRYDAGGQAAPPTPFTMAVGDGNHSLASAKALWEELKPGLSPAQRQQHPARYCLVELENVQSDAIEIEPIHRALFDADAGELRAAAAAFAASFGGRWLPAGSAKEQQQKAPERQRNTPAGLETADALAPGPEPAAQQFGLLWAGVREDRRLAGSPWPLAAGTLEAFLADYTRAHPDIRVDYIHGEDSLAQLVGQGAVGILLPPLRKSDLFRGVALGGVLPKKTFSMGHAQEKRYYLECRKIIAEIMENGD